MQDIRPPRPPIIPSEDSQSSSKPPATPSGVSDNSTLQDLPEVNISTTPRASCRRWLRRGLLGAAGVLIAAIIAALVWYWLSLQPVNTGDTSKRRVEIVVGSSPRAIADTLHDKGLIRSTLAFDIYTRLSGTRSRLQAGPYSLSPSQSTPVIVAALSGGKVSGNEFRITFVPGAVLHDTTDTSADRKQDVYTTLRRAGYSDGDITAAFAANYDDSAYAELFGGKPAGTSLEGYIYGDTYQFRKGTPVPDILERSLSEFAQVVKDNDLTAKFKKRGLTLYQGITLASIIQREVKSQNPNVPTADQRQVAQVFYLRLKRDMPLGSDVTAYYGADKVGKPRSVAVDTPYNTRIHPGLPPGPIATPGLGALLAATDPAAGDYLYFLTGDDGKTYFAHTNAEHEANIRDHCQKQCQME